MTHNDVILQPKASTAMWLTIFSMSVFCVWLLHIASCFVLELLNKRLNYTCILPFLTGSSWVQIVIWFGLLTNYIDWNACPFSWFSFLFFVLSVFLEPQLCYQYWLEVLFASETDTTKPSTNFMFVPLYSIALSLSLSHSSPLSAHFCPLSLVLIM